MESQNRRKIDKKQNIRTLLSPRVCNILNRIDINTFEDLEKYRELDLLMLHGFGQSCLHEITLLCWLTDLKLKPNFN